MSRLRGWISSSFAKGRLSTSDFTRRMQETQEWVGRLLVSFPSREAFVKNNYAQATALGELPETVQECPQL